MNDEIISVPVNGKIDLDPFGDIRWPGGDAAQAPDGDGLDVAGGEQFVEQAAADAEALGGLCDGEKERLWGGPRGGGRLSGSGRGCCARTWRGAQKGFVSVRVLPGACGHGGWVRRLSG